MSTLRTLALALALVSCRDASSKEAGPKPEPVKVAEAAGSGSGSAALTGAEKIAKEGQNAEEYIPNEYRTGMSRWRDTGVYLDGKPIAFLNFDELPITLKPTWVKDKVSDNKPPGCKECPGWKWGEQRFYKFNDYLKALGIDNHKVKMLHVYGSKLSQTIAVTSKDLLSPAADEFMFRFGGDVNGKPIPHVAGHFGNGKQPDKINGVMIYIEKKPPTITRDGIELDGVDQDGVPYYGEPLRGGIRIYLDDRLAAVIKRSELDTKKATQTPDHELHWSLADYLSSSGVDTSKVVEGWTINDGLRRERVAWSELSKMTFSADDKAGGHVLLGDKKLIAHVIALHTRSIAQDELPVIKPDEEP